MLLLLTSEKLGRYRMNPSGWSVFWLVLVLMWLWESLSVSVLPSDLSP